ncbi:MAG: tRNA dimethylallyltransferase [Gemmatimonadaceae bacterium]|nr:tRNA dimethylallyltransferase [Gemmatimonadaceae bacterium]
MSSHAELRIIVGPTAAGKSAIAMQLAEAVGAAIVSADSRQVYRGFDIGTAKPSVAERARVPHFGIDLADPVTRVSATVWAASARGTWLNEIERLGRHPLVVGGTGFYIRALVEPLAAVPSLDPVRRSELEIELARYSTPELRRWCEALDPSRAHLGRTQLLRAVETALLAGQRLSDSYRTTAGRAARLAARYLVVDPGASLAGRIERRVHEMLDRGWLSEVASLAATVPSSSPAWSATGYGVMRKAVLGGLPVDVAVSRTIVATRQYAKRQRTWFRHQLSDAIVTAVNPSEPDVMRIARAWWNGESV